MPLTEAQEARLGKVAEAGNLVLDRVQYLLRGIDQVRDYANNADLNLTAAKVQAIADKLQARGLELKEATAGLCTLLGI